MKSIQDCYKLNNGVEIPCIGFGTYKVTDARSEERRVGKECRL